MKEEWKALVIHADVATLSAMLDRLRPIFLEWTEANFSFNFNGYTEALNPHLSIRLPAKSGRWEDLLQVVQEAAFPFSISEQVYDEKLEVREAYILGSRLATLAHEYQKQKALGGIGPMSARQVVHGFVNSLGFLHAAEENELYVGIIESNERLLKKGKR